MGPSSDPIRVLHVDDDPGFEAPTATPVEGADERLVVETATSVDEALDRLDGDVDCIVSDYELPGRTGIEFLEAVREARPDLPFVLFTATGSEAVASEAISAGVTDYLRKEAGESRYAVLANRVANAVEQRRAERRAERIEEEYRLVAEAATDAFWTLDPDTGRIDMAGIQHFGYDDHGSDRGWWKRRIHPGDRDRVLADDEALLGGDGDAFDERTDDRGWFSKEYRWRRADGTYADCVERGVVLFEDGTPAKMIGTLTDVSERTEQERELRRYERMVNAMEEAACVYDAEGRFELVNDYLADFYGTSPDDLEGEPSNLVPRIRARADGDPYRELLDGERDEIRGEIAGTFPGVGHEVLAYRLTPMVAEGRVDGVVGVAREITERKRRAEELERTNALLATLFETLPVGVTVLDADGRIVRANRRAADVLGLASSEITDRTYDDSDWHVVGEDGEPIPDEALPFRRVIETGEPVFGCEHGIERPDGSERWLSVDAAPLSTEAEGAEEVVAVITDVTEQRDYERTLERQNERLAEFASVVGHDLRNPLTVAMGGLELVRDERDSEQLATVARAHDRMDALIDDLLTLAREGRETLEPQAVNLAACSRRCWRTVDTAETTLVTDVDRTIRADRGQLQQLLENVYRNAVEHGGRDVTVTVGGLDGGFYVEDDGPGIDPGARGDAFDRGYSTSTEGTGFGLYIVARIAEAHGWTPDVTDGDGGGARIEFTGVEFVDD
jgi:PAS domain S-box-containing protein